VSPVLPSAVAAAALADAEVAVAEYEGAVAWFSGRVDSYRMPLAVEVWVLDPTLTRVLWSSTGGGVGFRRAESQSGASCLGQRPRASCSRRLA
jgi:hypothetical protein